MNWAGAGALAMAAFFAQSGNQYDPAAWTFSYCVMAASMMVGVVTVLISPEPNRTVPRETSEQTQRRLTESRLRHPTWSDRKIRLSVWFYEAACLPFLDFFTRFRRYALVVLALIATYRISDVVMGVMANPFYQDLGFTKEEVAAVSKVFGVVMTLLGAFLGGIISAKFGVMKTLFLGALLSALTNLLFSWLALQGHQLTYLVFTVSADNLAAGIASVAFLAYLSGLTNVAYTATQYALFSSIMLLLPKFLAGFSGFVVESVGYSHFFTLTAVIGIPVLILVIWASHVKPQNLTERFLGCRFLPTGIFAFAGSLKPRVAVAICITHKAMSSIASSRFSSGESDKSSSRVAEKSPISSSGRWRQMPIKAAMTESLSESSSPLQV